MGVSAKPQELAAIVHVETERPMRRLLAFAGHSIDDVINCPIARGKVRGYFKLDKWMQRQIEIGDLERQWNPLGQRVR